MQSFTITTIINDTPKQVYNAWLDSNLHSKMTGGKAITGNKINDTFTAWDKYISGKNLELVENKKIVQAWRTTEFKPQDKDSKIEIILEQVEKKCKITLTHSNIPEDSKSDYKIGWEEHYFKPMKEYFIK